MFFVITASEGTTIVWSLSSFIKFTSPNIPLLRFPSALSISMSTSYVPPSFAEGFIVEITPVLFGSAAEGIFTVTLSPKVTELTISSETLTLIFTFDVSEILKGSFVASTVPASTFFSVT